MRIDGKTLKRITAYWPYAVLVLIVCVFGIYRVRNFVPGHSESDLDAYFFLAKQMARFDPVAVTTDTPFLYQQHPWVETVEGRITAKFAPGYPLLMAPFYWLFGDNGLFLVSPVAAMLTVIAAFLLFRLWMSDGAALLALTAMCVNLTFFFYSGYPLAHSANVCLVTWGMYGLWRWMGQT
ncbi:MAG: hypothetical protein R6V03_07390, partial [Kiritimatiellia bacterium]